MIDKLVLIEGAYFYNYVKKISKSAISNAFKEISKNKKGNYIENKVKEKVMVSGEEIIFSICIFKYEQLPTFFT